LLALVSISKQRLDFRRALFVRLVARWDPLSLTRGRRVGFSGPGRRQHQSADPLAQLKILDGHIAGRDWFALNRFTIADIALGSIVKRCLEFPIVRPAYSELERWQTAIDARPAFAVAIGAKPSVLTSAA
jgi:glutathione S-transferase